MPDILDMLRGAFGGPVLPPKPPPAPKMEAASQGLAGPGPDAATAEQFYNPKNWQSRPVPEVRSLFPSHDAPQSLLDVFQKPPVPMPRPMGGPPESLSSPDAYPGQLDMPPRMDPARLYPSLPAHMPPYNLTPDPPGNLFNAFGDPSLAPGPNTGVPLHQRMTAGGRRYDYVDDKRGTSRHEAVVAMLEKLMKDLGIDSSTSAIHRRGR